MDLYEAVYNRRIVRDFKDKIVPEETLKKLLTQGCKPLLMTIKEIGNL